MKRVAMSVVCFTVLLAFSQIAIATCAEMLRSNISTPLPLPLACRRVGPLELGMTRIEVTKVLGRPDATTTKDAYITYQYVFPRDLAAKLRAKPLPQGEVAMSFLMTTFHNGTLVSVNILGAGAPVPYAIDGIKVYGLLNSVLHSIATKPVWNASKDNVYFYPYPIEMYVDRNRDMIMGFTIASTNQALDFGHAPGVQWIRDAITGDVRGYKLIERP